jgi:hypothetical protein
VKKIAALISGAVLATSAICSATVSPDTIAVGKIVPGMAVSDVIAMYGQPVSRKGDELRFQGFTIEVDDKRPNIVEEIEVFSGTLATPTGVKIGQGLEVLNKAYGTADKVDDDFNESEYEYYSHDYSKKIEFEIRNGVITKIKCKIQD